jgi:RNA polymerase sigma-70 factor (ECF subfamily)
MISLPQEPFHPPDDEDGPLVAAAQHAPAAFARLYDRYVTRIYRYHASRVETVADAEDLTAQTFLSALEALPRYRHRGLFPAWLFAIARSKLIDHVRQKRPQRLEGLSAGEASDPAFDSVDYEAVQRLRLRIAALDDEDKELMRLRDVAGLSHADVAALLGKSEAAVKKAHSRLIERLRREMEERHG